jgi:hypothetical protein
MTESDDLVNAFVHGREALLRAALAMPPHMRSTPFVGYWNLLDLLAHLVGWDYTNLNAVAEIKAGRIPDFYRHYDPGWASYNRQLIDRYGSSDWQELLDALGQSQEAVVTVMCTLTPEETTRELSQPGRRRPVSIAAIVRAAIRDEREHARQVRAFNTRPPEG